MFENSMSSLLGTGKSLTALTEALIFALKLEYSENASKFEKIFHLKFEIIQ